ncbi:hypothetical protein [Candidatus Cryosericum terrychapinii]|jgi:hypothetical protein|nr:hypothetical protein [Candidatus Cryosericum terrychapinii]
MVQPLPLCPLTSPVVGIFITEDPKQTLLWADSDVQVLEEGWGEIQVSLDPGSNRVGYHQGLELI